MPIALSINGEIRRFDADTISVGRGPENVISLPHDERLAPLQAILKCVAGRWIVEAQGGGAVRVGNGRPAQFAWINPGDVIHLTESGPELTFEPGGAVAKQPAPAPIAQPIAPLPQFILPLSNPVIPRAAASQPMVGRETDSGRQAAEAAALGGRPLPDARPSAGAAADAPGRSTIAPHGKWTLSIVAGGIAVFLLVGLGILVGGRGGPAAGHVAGQNPEEPLAPDGASSTGLGSQKSSGEKTLAPDPRSALFRLELQTTDGKRSVQLGSAWAVGPRRLVTTGDAARGIALNQEFYPTAVARHAVSREPYEISGMSLHPQYEAAASRLDQAVRRIEQLKSDYEETKDPSERRELERLAREQDAAAMLAAEEAVNVNVAVLDVGKDLSGALSWVDAPGASAKVGQKLTLVGHPLSLVDVLVDPDHPVPVEQRMGRLRHVEPSPDAQVPPRWLVGFDDPLKEQNWSGSPVLDSNGVVVGVYSRPTPPTPGAGSGAIVTHDVTVVESLRALMSGNKSQH